MRKLILVLYGLLICGLAIGQPAMAVLAAKKAAAGGGPTPPTFISETETAWNSTTSPKTTASISVNNGDVLVAFSVVEDHAASVSIAGGSLTWTLQQEVNITNFTRVFIWTTTATSTTSFTVSFTRTATARFFGGNVFVFRGSDGVGASNKTNTTGTPSLTLTTSFANSAIVVVNGDWSGQDGTSRTWLTVNSITPSSGAGTELTYFRDAAHYATYGAYYTNAGTATGKTVGLSAPGTQTYSIVAVEVRGH